MAADSLYHHLVSSRAWRLYPFLVLVVTSLALPAPHLPTLLTNDFASRRLGRLVRCDAGPPVDAAAAAACRDAHSDVALWSGGTSFVSNAGVALVAVPWVGRVSDDVGRRPFLLLTVLCTLVVVAVVWAHMHLGLSLTWYYVAQVVANGVGALAVCLAYLGDLLPEAHRGAAFGLLLGAVSGGLVLGAAAGAALTPEAALVAAAALLVFCLAYVGLALVESRDVHASRDRRGAGDPGHAAAPPPLGPAGTFAILTRSELFVRLTLCTMLLGATQEGITDLLAQFLQLKLGFDVGDQGALLVITGLGMLVVQGLLLQPLRSIFRDRGLLLLGLSVQLLCQVAIGAAATKAQALTAVGFATLGSVTFPVISSLKSCHAGEEEQGAVQGALLGARAMAAGIGPLLFSGLFALFSRAESPALYFPAAPFVLGAACMAAALCVAWGVPDTTPELARLERGAGTDRPARDGEAAERATLLTELQVAAD